MQHLNSHVLFTLTGFVLPLDTPPLDTPPRLHPAWDVPTPAGQDLLYVLLTQG
jgi:hypothetical protein